MKTKLMFCTLAMVTLAFAAQESIKLERKYKEGEKDVYKIAMQMNMGGDVNVTLKTTQTVKKVFENGDADIESASSDLKVNFNNQEMSPPAQPPSVARYNKNGMPIGVKANKGRGQMNMSFMRYAFAFTDKAFKVGETIPIDFTDPANAKDKVTGTVKVDSLENGVAKFIANLDIRNEDTGDKPMKVAITSWVDVASSKPNKVTGTVSNITGPQGMQIEGVQLSIERVK